MDVWNEEKTSLMLQQLRGPAVATPISLASLASLWRLPLLNWLFFFTSVRKNRLTRAKALATAHLRHEGKGRRTEEKKVLQS